jgi:hypothetical protein
MSDLASSPQHAGPQMDMVLKTMLSGVINAPWWTGEQEPASRLDKLADCACAFAEAASLAYPDSGPQAWTLAGEAVVSAACSDQPLLAAFGSTSVSREPFLSTDAKMGLARRMVGKTANAEQKSGLFAGIAGLSLFHPNYATRHRQEGNANGINPEDSWNEVAQEAAKQCKIIETNRQGSPHAFERAQEIFVSAQKSFVAPDPGGLEVFLQEQSAAALRALVLIDTGDDRSVEGLELALSVAQNTALSKDPRAQRAFDTALSAVASLMERENALWESHHNAQRALSELAFPNMLESKTSQPPQEDSAAVKMSRKTARQELDRLSEGETAQQMNARFKRERKALNQAASFWIGALQDPEMEPQATRFLKISLAREPELISETQNERASRKSNFESLRWAWARAGCGSDPSSESFETFSARAGWDIKPHVRASLMLFKDANHAACSVLHHLVGGLNGNRFDSGAAIRALKEVEQSQNADSPSFCPEFLENPHTPSRLEACKEGFTRICEHLLAVGKGEVWREVNDQLRASCGPSWSLDNPLTLQRATEAGKPVDAVASALRADQLSSYDPSLLSDLSAGLTESKDRLIAMLEAQELRESIGRMSTSKPNSRPRL